jgi:hypothetical protein
LIDCLEWNIQWGDSYDKLKAMEDEGQIVPALERKPEPYPDLTLAWRAFFELNSRRQVGFDYNPISMDAIIRWLDLYEIAGDDRIQIFELISIMDAYWLRREYERRPKPKAPKKG